MEMNREQAIDLDNDTNWGLFKNELEKIVKGETEQLLVAEGTDVIRLQERVRAFRFVTRLPQIIAEREEDLIEVPSTKIIT
jgi:hypothetical protein